MRLYVGNFPYATTEAELIGWFMQYGTVTRAEIIFDRDTQRSKGFGFVDLDDQEAQEAMNALNGAKVGNRELRVSEAKPREERRPENGQQSSVYPGRPGIERRPRW